MMQMPLLDQSRRSGPTQTVISADFFPMIGGAHQWLYQTFRRWPHPIAFIAGHARAQNERVEQLLFDQQNHGAIESIVRADLNLDPIDVLHPCFHYRLLRAALQVLSRLPRGVTVLYSLRAFPEGIVALLAKIMLRNKLRLVTYLHGEELLIADTSRQLRFLARTVYNSSDLVIANSKYSCTALANFTSVSPTVIINPGVSSDYFRVSDSERVSQRMHWCRDGNPLVLLTVSRLEPRKNHVRVIESVRELLATGLDLLYVIVGDGPEAPALRHLVHHYNLTNSVIFTGRLTDDQLRLAYGAADIFIMPSVSTSDLIEGFGIVFLEAAASGLPSIAGRAGGQSEAVLHNETGLIVNGTRTQELRASILALRDPSLRHRLGIAARRWAQQHDWAVVTARTFDAVSHLQPSQSTYAEP